MSYYQQTNPNRQKFTRSLDGAAARQEVPEIKTLEELRSRLQQAIQLEHFTIPPYLCALYSIKDGANGRAARIIRSVVVEEMLHMIMAANILNAIGGTPRIKAKDFLPHYPSLMPHSAIDFEVGLIRFSKEAINTFLRIERPADPNVKSVRGKFRSIGEFYASVRAAIIKLDGEAKAQGNKDGIFTGDPERQVKEYYGSGGTLISVRSVDDANLAIDEIEGQGEGINSAILSGDDGDCDPNMFDDDVEFAHYFRFNEIFNERRYRLGDKPSDAPSGDPLPVDWDAVYNMIPNPAISRFEHEPLILKKAKEFNRTYIKVLDNLNLACNGQPKALEDSVLLMYALRDRAVALMKSPIGEGNYTAGPTFEFVNPEPKQRP